MKLKAPTPKTPVAASNLLLFFTKVPNDKLVLFIISLVYFSSSDT